MSAINGGCPLHYPITTRKPCSSPRGLGFATRGRRLSSSPEAKLKVADSCRARPPRREPVLTAAPATAVSPVTRRGGAEMPNDPSFQMHNNAQAEQQRLSSAPSSRNAAPSKAASKSSTSRWQHFRRMMSKRELKRLMKRYGPIALAFHSTVFVSTLGGFYAVVDYGFDVQSLLATVPIIADNMPHPSAGNLAVAWGLTTCTGPLRGILTIVLSPRIARFWWGREVRNKLEDDEDTAAATGDEDWPESPEKKGKSA